MSGRTIISGLDGASNGIYLPGISTVISPMTSEVANSISTFGISDMKAWARVLTVMRAATAGIGGAMEGSTRSSSVSAMESKALARSF